MGWLPMYINEDDAKVVCSWLSEERDIAFIVSSGPKKWRAEERLDEYGDARYCVWHCRSGPLPLLRKMLPDGRISNPWKGWKQKITGGDPTIPYFGPGHPGVYWLDLRTRSQRNPGALGLSGISWIGDYYKALGNPAPEVTKKWWQRLRRWVKKQAIRIPRKGPCDGPNPEIWTFPSAFREIQNGRKRDVNP